VASKVSSRQIDTKGPVLFFTSSIYNNSRILVAGISSRSVSYPSFRSKCIIEGTPKNTPVTVRVYETTDTGSIRGRRSSYFGIKESWSSLFKPLAELVVPLGLHSCSIIDNYLVLMGSDGFQFVNLSR
jgi:hypothetical protein